MLSNRVKKYVYIFTVIVNKNKNYEKIIKKISKLY